MRVRLSKEAKQELDSLSALDRNVGIALDAIDANEFEGQEGFSIKRIGGMFRKGIRLYRMKYEKYFSGIRVLFFSIPRGDCVFVTGIHARSDLGVGRDYNFSREPFARAVRYWGMKERLC
ncbi:MAG TPA: hypothetical protein VGL03_06775 [Thermoanaerobaculia bacterium]|jgi:hypothetical protein